jgi:hypothetical protein
VREAIDFLTKTPLHPLPPSGVFLGVGVYILYYLGDAEHYSHIAALNKNECTYPIYVGKAVPPGWRTARLFVDKSRALCGRLQEHARSIEQIERHAEREGLQNYLKVADFRCRFIIFHGIEADLITAVEAQSIRLWTPIWNTYIDGFGNHDPGSGRYNQATSEWDVLHPGRSWAGRLTGTAPSLENILRKIERHRQQLSSS